MHIKKPISTTITPLIRGLSLLLGIGLGILTIICLIFRHLVSVLLAAGLGQNLKRIGLLLLLGAVLCLLIPGINPVQILIAVGIFLLSSVGYYFSFDVLNWLATKTVYFGFYGSFEGRQLSVERKNHEENL